VTKIPRLTARDDNQRAFAAWALVAVAVLVGPVLVPIAAGWAVLRLALR